MRRSAAAAVAAMGLVLLFSPALPAASSTAATTEANDESECFSAVQTAHPRAGLAGGGRRRLAKKAPKATEALGGKGEPPEPKTTEDRMHASEAKILENLTGQATRPMELDGLAQLLTRVVEKVAELEARLEQVEEAGSAKSALVQKLEERLRGKEAASETAAARSDREAPQQGQGQAASEERATVLRHGQQRALSSLLRRDGSKSGFVSASCPSVGPDIRLDGEGLQVDLGRYACSVSFDLGLWGGISNISIFNIDLNFGRYDYPSFLSKLGIFSKFKDKLSELFPSLPEMTSLFFTDLCPRVVEHLSFPSATVADGASGTVGTSQAIEATGRAAGADVKLLETKHSSVHVYRRGVSVSEASTAEAVVQELGPRRRNLVFAGNGSDPEECLFFRKGGAENRTGFSTADSFFAPCADAKDLGADVSLGPEPKAAAWKGDQCYNHSADFNLPITLAMGAGVAFDVLPPTVAVNFWACFADWQQILEGKASLAVFGLEVFAFGIRTIDVQVPIENPIAKHACNVAGLQEDTQPSAAANRSYAEFKGPPPKPRAGLQGVDVDVKKKRIARGRPLTDDEARRALARAMKRRPPTASLAEAGTDSQADADADVGTQQLFELRVGDVPASTNTNEDLTIVDNDLVGLALRGGIRGGKLQVGLDLRVGGLIAENKDFELLDFRSVIAGGLSLVDCVSPCFKDLALKAWDDYWQIDQ